MINTIIRTETGKEEKAIASAKEHGLTFTSPQCTVEVRKTRWDRIAQRVKRARRPKIEKRPVLPGYLFAYMTDYERSKVHFVRHIYADVTDVNTPRDAEQIARFMQRVERGDFNHDGAFPDLQPGRIMQMIGGVFDKLLVSYRNRNGDMLTVEADVMGRKTPMRVSIDEVELV